VLANRTLLRCAALIPSLALAAFAADVQAKTWTYTLVHHFSGAPDDGSYPNSEVAFDDTGNLYGTTYIGGSNGTGAIYRITQDGTETVAHSFGDGSDGENPNGGISIDRGTGDLYGTTNSGGPTGCCGVVWKLATDGTFSVLHVFEKVGDGKYPNGRLIRDERGNLYGVTKLGGANGDGTIYRISAKGRFASLYSFGGNDGAYPVGGLERDRAGSLYGATEQGGNDGVGTVFRLARDGTLTTQYSFAGDGRDGDYPEGGVQRDGEGNLFGTTHYGGRYGEGVLFELGQDGKYTILHSFGRTADGAYPYGDLLLTPEGTLYGTTPQGGAQPACGTVYELKPGKRERVFYNFTCANGSGNPSVGLVRYKGSLYGVATSAGSDDPGVVFGLTKE